MKNGFKKIIALVCLLALMVSINGIAGAETASLKSTRDFLDFLDSNGIKYSYIGMTEVGEKVSVFFTMDNHSPLECLLFFNEDCEEVSLRIWDIVAATAGKNHIYSSLNTLNHNYKFVKFVCDDSDSTIQAEMDMYIDGSHCGRAVYDAMMAMFSVIDDDAVADIIHSLE